MIGIGLGMGSGIKMENRIGRSKTFEDLPHAALDRREQAVALPSPGPVTRRRSLPDMRPVAPTRAPIGRLVDDVVHLVGNHLPTALDMARLSMAHPGAADVLARSAISRAKLEKAEKLEKRAAEVTDGDDANDILDQLDKLDPQYRAPALQELTLRMMGLNFKEIPYDDDRTIFEVAKLMNRVINVLKTMEPEKKSKTLLNLVYVYSISSILDGNEIYFDEIEKLVASCKSMLEEIPEADRQAFHTSHHRKYTGSYASAVSRSSR